MDILAPLKDPAALPILSGAGVDAVYLGFYDPEFSRRFGDLACINRMSNFSQKANSIPIGQLCQAVRDIHAAGKRCYITMNAAQYSDPQLQQMLTYLDILQQEKPDGIIVSGWEMARQVLQRGMEPVASTMCAIYNADSVRFYAALGVKHMIFPREVTLEEMARLCAQFPQIRFEAFFMRNGCRFSDAACLGIHARAEGGLCAGLCRGHTAIQGDRQDFAGVHAVEETSILYHRCYHERTCGMCALYRLLHAGVGTLKIVGRADEPEFIAADIALAKRNLEIARASATEEAYLNNMEFPQGRFSLCKNGLSCYYPDIRFPAEKARP